MLRYGQSSRFCVYLLVCLKQIGLCFQIQHIVHNQDPPNILEINILSYRKYNHVTISNVSFQFQVKINAMQNHHSNTST